MTNDPDPMDDNDAMVMTTSAPSATKGQSRKKWLLIILVLAIIGIVVGVVFGVTSSPPTPTSAPVESTPTTDGCVTLAKGTTEDLTLSSSSSNCFVVPGAASEEYRLTIRNKVYGRYTIDEPTVGGVTDGYAWDSPADGIYYCAQGGLTITFDEFVEEATVTVTADLVEDGYDCFSDYISFNGYVPVDTPPNGVTSEVYWSSHRYYLHAEHFEYQVTGEDPVTMENAASIEVSGDPGDDAYFSIEVYWSLNGLQKRLFAYIDGGTDVIGDAPMWSIREVRVYDETEEWESFENPGVVLGDYDAACFTAGNLTIANSQGSEIRFVGLTVAAGLPWADEDSFFECIGRA